MKHILAVSAILASVALLQSCTKVIDVKLRDSDKKYVVEANIADEPGNCAVLLSQTKSFSSDNSFAGISGATVVLTDQSTGASRTLTEAEPGVYKDDTYAGLPGHTYAINITTGTYTFTAISTMPQKVNFDSLYITTDGFFGGKTILANADFKDPDTFGNCYQAREYINGKQVQSVFVTNDDYTNGKVMKTRLYIFGAKDDEKAKAGDTVTVDMLCIDQAAYKYWYSLDQSATGSSQSAAPTNPVTNIEGGAIGYFSAHTIQTRTIVVPENI